MNVGQRINLPNGKYAEVAQVDDDGRVVVIRTDLSTTQFGEPTEITYNPAQTRSGLFEILMVEDPGE